MKQQNNKENNNKHNIKNNLKLNLDFINNNNEEEDEKNNLKLAKNIIDKKISNEQIKIVNTDLNTQKNAPSMKDNFFWLLFILFVSLSIYLHFSIEYSLFSSEKALFQQCTSQGGTIFQCFMEGSEKQSIWDDCLFNRVEISKEQRQFDIYSHLAAVTLLHLNLTYLLLTSKLFSNEKRSWKLLFVISFALLWIPSFQKFAFYLKDFLNDVNCNRKANSVSGHFAYFLFHILLWRYFNRYEEYYRNTIEKKGTGKKIFEKFRDILLILLVFTVLTRTYFGGYHSLRQIIFGSLFGLISFSLFQFFVHLPNYLSLIGLLAVGITDKVFFGTHLYGAMENYFFYFVTACLILSYSASYLSLNLSSFKPKAKQD